MSKEDVERVSVELLSNNEFVRRVTGAISYCADNLNAAIAKWAEDAVIYERNSGEATKTFESLATLSNLDQIDAVRVAATCMFTHWLSLACYDHRGDVMAHVVKAIGDKIPETASILTAVNESIMSTSH